LLQGVCLANNNILNTTKCLYQGRGVGALMCVPCGAAPRAGDLCIRETALAPA